jgi:hypothetical protein
LLVRFRRDDEILEQFHLILRHPILGATYINGEEIQMDTKKDYQTQLLLSLLLLKYLIANLLLMKEKVMTGLLILKKTFGKEPME